MNQIATQALNALDEYISSCTVVIASTNARVHHGSGVAVMYNSQYYILTAAHVLNGEPDNQKIRVIGKADGPLQLLRGKKELAGAIAMNRSQVFSSATSISITGRLIHDGDDIAVLKVKDFNASLPHTMFHNLSVQREAQISVGEPVSLFGFPGELAKSYEHTPTGRHGLAAFPHVTEQTIRAITDWPNMLDPSVNLIVDFDYPEDKCDPHGMSGCGVWSFPMPQPNKSDVWSVNSQLLGIQMEWAKRSKLLRCVRIERVLHLLTATN